MGRQSTRHRYKTRREKNARAARNAKFIFGGLAVLLVLLLLRNWREYWAYWKTYFY